MNRSKLYLIIAITIIAIVGVGLVIAVMIEKNRDEHQIPSSPEESRTIDDMSRFLDDQTKQALNENLLSYTRKPIDNFTIKNGSYSKDETSTQFQLTDNTSGALYNIKIEPDETGDFNYVYISCAYPDQQNPGVSCMVYTEHHEV